MNLNFQKLLWRSGALILFLVSGKIRFTSSPTTSLFIKIQVMKDASDFNYHLDLPETRKSFLYDSSELFKKRSLWLRHFVFCQTNPQMEYQMFTTGNSWLEEWWSRKEDTTISPRKVFLLTFSFPKLLSLFPGKENSSFRLRPSDKGAKQLCAGTSPNQLAF